MKRRKIWSILALAALTGSLLAGCGEVKTEEQTKETQHEEKPVELLVAAAASLEYSYEEELLPMFEKENPNITVKGTYDSSGKLQTQIEEGIESDVFMSAATKQMNALTEQGLVEKDSVVDLLQNQIVLITAADSTLDLQNFEDITKANVIAIGDPESVPVGQYSKEVLTNLGIWDAVSAKASLGTNVTEVLKWVEEGRSGKCSGRTVFERSADQSGNLGCSVCKGKSRNQCYRSFKMGRRGQCRRRNRVCDRCSDYR